ncbi:hypothetical protein [Niallia taxi]|uniref:hypothetical protein n=1 Tax=Niallia taxi TaxID=2499688 RepID=UPI0011A7131A|nr:hypothetical protein [Niallia taxi]MED3963406.1 hypothetical protein [Niallia taxi]
MKTLRILFLLLFSTILVSGCTTNKKNETIQIDIPNAEQYTVLYIQGVDTNGVSSETTSKYITGEKEIKSFIKKINKMEVVKPSKNEIKNKVKELNNQGNYTFVLSDSKTMDNTVYNMNFFKDGSIQFQSTDKNEIIYLSEEKHPEVIEELKNTFKITF